MNLITLDGKTVFKTFNQINEANSLLNDKLKTLEKGIYILSISGKKGSCSSKIIKN